MVNHAFDSDNRIATQEWMDNRMYLVTRAENMLRGLPFSKSEPLPLIFLFTFKLCVPFSVFSPFFATVD